MLNVGKDRKTKRVKNDFKHNAKPEIEGRIEYFLL